ncbi:hypothetical protein [Novosphingobium ginsenosidimutans]|uniref:DUF4124 domain-containing protein n=1 Tax=Novosphingobium ginsenosidimutans TaxID=1176536 RepID=A0A5B8S2U9_9SPHN|nr:hypothetical protein [Novosphingobium ginsenosidimutans]QEA15799.1 hypothetical protein FRF71_06400 [Novosphingobium ginsenosidimutans]
MRRLLIAVPLLFAAAPALAQDAPEPKVNQLIVYGNDECPVSADDTITVCARKAEAERFRIPQILRQSSSPQNEAWNNKVLAYERVSKTGTMSCSPVGAGGWTGCSGRLIDAAYAEKQSDESIRFGQLIAEERAKRLSTIDKDAAKTQTDVEKLEDQMEARQKAEAEAAKKPEGGN